MWTEVHVQAFTTRFSILGPWMFSPLARIFVSRSLYSLATHPNWLFWKCFSGNTAKRLFENLTMRFWDWACRQDPMHFPMSISPYELDSSASIAFTIFFDSPYCTRIEDNFTTFGTLYQGINGLIDIQIDPGPFLSLVCQSKLLNHGPWIPAFGMVLYTA